MKKIQFLFIALLAFIVIPNLQAQEEEIIFTVVENMPVFPSCETAGDAAAQKQCTETKLLQHISEHLLYPTIARENYILGLVVVSFVVNKEGKIEAVKCVKDIGAGCGEEAIRVIKLMNEKNLVWTPGKHKGEIVKVKYNVPVRFNLQKDEKKRTG